MTLNGLSNRFKLYDKGAEITQVQDPNVVYSLKDELDDAHLFTPKMI